MPNLKSQISNLKLPRLSYIFVVICLFLYSFTQVDLGLTLTKWSIWQVFQRFFQNIGYFNRPLSALLYSSIIALLFIFYGFFLWLASKKKTSTREAWFIILISSLILTFSYNAFSYDFFNYIFYGKIITHYHQNPYFQKAIDYPGDPMLGFMHWTHNTYPYGPIWLVLTTPLSFLGFQFFLLTFFLYKILMSASFVGTVFFIGKIVKKILPENEVFSLVFFGLNPLILIESLVSAHNDIVMIFFLLSSFYLFLNKKYFRSLLLLIVSIGVKYITALFTPVLLIIYLFQRGEKEIPWEKITLLSIILMASGTIYASFRTNFQPWYLLYFFPFAAMVGRNHFVLIPSVVLSFFALLRYLPFLYTGNWDPPIPAIIDWLIIASVIFSFLIILFYLSVKRLVIR